VSLPSFDDLYAAADQRAARTPVAVACAADRTVLEALRVASQRGWVSPIACGDEAQIRRFADDCEVELAGFEFVESAEPAEAAVAAIRSGRARLLMKGQISTPDLMRAVLAENGLRTGRVVCQTPLMEIVTSGRRFLLADTGITIHPTLEQRIDILRSAVAMAHMLGVDEPRVALLAATDKTVASMPDTLEAAEIVRRHESGEITGCRVQGPLSFDLAYAAEAGDRKQMAGPVVGSADVMIFPNLLAANLTVKAIMYTAPCRFGGVLRGTACPVVFMSRADSVETRLNSLALALKLTATIT
jgi:phosphate butyryltransferase